MEKEHSVMDWRHNSYTLVMHSIDCADALGNM